VPLFPINVLNGAVGVVIVPTPATLPVSCSVYDWSIGARGPWRPWAQHLGPWLGLCLLVIGLMRVCAVTAWPICAAVHACSPALPGSLPQWPLCQCFASYDPHSVHGFLGPCSLVCLDDCVTTLVSLRSPAMLVPYVLFNVSVLSARLLGLCSLVCLLDDVTVPWYQSLFFHVVRAQCTGLTLSYWPQRATFFSSRGTERLATCATFCACETFAL